MTLEEPDQGDCQAAEKNRQQLNVVQMRDVPDRLVQWIAGFHRHAGERRDLAEDNEHRRGVHEAADHRMTQQIDEPTHLPQAQQPKDDAHLQTEDDGDAGR